MLRVGVLGINHKLADLPLREALAKACQRQLGMGQYPYVVLSTCNRTEVYFSSLDLAETHTQLLSILREEVDCEFDHKLYSYFHQDCFFHLSKVTAGLDSAIIAETEIQGQVKAAYEIAHKHHPLPSEIHFLFQKSLKISKQVRSALPMGHGLPNLEHAILYTGMQWFENIQEAKILFVGASDINQNVIRLFKSKKIKKRAVCNRTLEHGQHVANHYGLDVLPWSQLHTWTTFDWIILGTKSPEHLLTKEHVSSKFCGQKLVMDLSVPRNVDPNLPHVKLFNIDQMNQMLRIRRKGLAHTLVLAEKQIAEATRTHSEAYMQKEQKRLKFCI